MLLQTNSYIVPKDKRAEHARLVRRFRAALARLGCDSFEVYEQVGSNWNAAEPTGRYVQMMRFRDRRHQLAVQAAERNDPTAQAIIAEFCELINFPYQQQQGLFAVGFYSAVIPAGSAKAQPRDTDVAGEPAAADPTIPHVPPAAPEPAPAAPPEAEPTFADGDVAVDAMPEPSVEPAPVEVDRPAVEPSDQSDNGAPGPQDFAAILDPHLEPTEAGGSNGDAHRADHPENGELADNPLAALDLSELDLGDAPAERAAPAPDHATR